jgi:hypothetical protein
VDTEAFVAKNDLDLGLKKTGEAQKSTIWVSFISITTSVVFFLQGHLEGDSAGQVWRVSQ